MSVSVPVFPVSVSCLFQCRQCSVRVVSVLSVLSVSVLVVSVSPVSVFFCFFICSITVPMGKGYGTKVQPQKKYQSFDTSKFTGVRVKRDEAVITVRVRVGDRVKVRVRVRVRVKVRVRRQGKGNSWPTDAQGLKALESL